jgi:hypothetical protein
MPSLFLREEARADLTEAFNWYEQRRSGYEVTRSVRSTLQSSEGNAQQYPLAAAARYDAPFLDWRNDSVGVFSVSMQRIRDSI